MKTARTVLALASLLVASPLASCGGGGGTADGGDGGGAPAVEIINPMPNSTIATTGQVGVIIGVTNYMLEGSALCGAGMTNCGQARLTVDGGSCGSQNMTGAQLSFPIDLSMCGGGRLANGSSHSVTAVLLDGSGNPIPGATATANFTVMTM